MAKTYFGFAVADSMFQGDVTIARRCLSVEEAKAIIAGGVIACLNPSHQATIDAAKVRYGIEVEIPATAPKVSLGTGDQLVVMGVRGLPRLDATRHEYTEDEIASATFAFSLYSVL